ncbi:MAG TPA: Fe-S cluster assembly protein SufD [Pseudolabrys sp.]|nr:Fe-S cluster assembly protein SufD [Pseudolabrys sp.]
MADVTPIKTSAEQALSAAFAAARGTLPGRGAVDALREAAFERFDAAGLPHRRVEEWKYTDLRTLMREAKPLAGPAGKPAAIPTILGGVEADTVAIVNGRYEPGWTKGNTHDPGVTVDELFKFLADNSDYKLGKVPGTDDPAYWLNTAFMSGGVALRVKRGAAVTKPIHVAHIFSGDAAAAMYPRSVAIVEPGAQLTLVESFFGPEGLDYQLNSALELVIGDGARVDHIKVGCDGGKALRVSTLGVTVGAKATYRDFAFTLGGAVVRNQTFVRFAGEGSEGAIDGANLLKGRQHVDNTLVISHAVGHCVSRERFKSVLDGESHGIFQGKIIVEPHAQKTDGKMMTRALLLSDEAEADNKPELEIFADDVVCGHGATAGALDPGLKFYLMSRGIPAPEAEALLVQAFIGEVIDEIAHEGIRDALMFAALKWLGSRS